MTDAQPERGRSGRGDRSTGRRWIISVMVLMLLLAVPGVPVTASATVGQVVCAILTLGACEFFISYPSFSPTPQAEPTVAVNCSNPVMTTAPQIGRAHV